MELNDKQKESLLKEAAAYFDGEIYLPNDDEVANFVKYYYNRYEMIGNEIDESGEWQKWQN